jgi:hypothetical protein
VCTCEKIMSLVWSERSGLPKRCQHYSNFEVTFVELCQIVFIRRRNESYFLFWPQRHKGDAVMFFKDKWSFRELHFVRSLV